MGKYNPFSSSGNVSEPDFTRETANDCVCCSRNRATTVVDGDRLCSGCAAAVQD